ncbi:MAG: DUF4163 domain-containing protein [Hyphomicrobiales bacterium]|nr:DUF4163 domain-containing protein [Hyphomicrobiales bacterium]
MGMVVMKKRWIAAALFAAYANAPAWGAPYDMSETTDTYSLSLHIPEAALAIEPLKAEILRRYQVASKETKDGSEDEKKWSSPEDFRPYELDTQWRVTFESPRVISMSGLIHTYEAGAHPNDDFDTIVWDKAAGRALPLPELFEKAKLPAALHDISEHAKATFLKQLASKERKPVDPEGLDESIAADPDKLGHYALTYARGETKANGIVLLYGAGSLWAFALGNVKLPIPVSVFRKHLTADWAGQFK